MLILKAEIKHNLVKSNGTPAKILDIQGTNFFQPMILFYQYHRKMQYPCKSKPPLSRAAASIVLTVQPFF